MNERQGCDKNSGRKDLKEEKAGDVRQSWNQRVQRQRHYNYRKPPLPPSFQYSTIPSSRDGGIEYVTLIAKFEFCRERLSEFPAPLRNVRRQSLPYSLSPPLLQLDGNMNLRHLLRQTRREYLSGSSRAGLSNTLFRPYRGCP